MASAHAYTDIVKYRNPPELHLLRPQNRHLQAIASGSEFTSTSQSIQHQRRGYKIIDILSTTFTSGLIQHPEQDDEPLVFTASADQHSHC